MVTETFTTSGTWTVPDGVTEVDAEVVGGGASGRRGATIGNGAGGGGGAYASSTLAVTSGAMIDFVVGAGGIGDAGSGTGTDGTGSWFETSGTVFADFGKGTGNGSTGSGGSGGLAANSIGTVTVSGQDGNVSANGNGGDAASGGTVTGGTGGVMPGVTGQDPGQPPGGGGSGANGDASVPGGDGARGVVVLTYTQVITNVTPPAITGTTQVGQTLTTDGGTWDPPDVSLSYQWHRDGVDIVGATASTLDLVAADEGVMITVTVTAMKPNFTSAQSTSSAVGPVTQPPEPGGAPPISAGARNRRLPRSRIRR